MIIGVFDSGIGGRSVLAAIKRLLPDEQYIYYADTAHCPYGSKPLPELRHLVSADVDYLLARGAKLIVVACNTATTQTIDFLRQTYPSVPFVGTEPAVKLACEESAPDAKILVLATEGTARSSRLHALISQHKRPNQTVEVLPCPGLAAAIETGSSSQISAKLSEVLSALKIRSPQGSSGPKLAPDVVVLGCTHYSLPFPKSLIQTTFPKSRLVDGGDGVAREVARLIKTMI